jgi:archaemetzincin
MGEPQDYDWLASFKEPGQTFEEYLSENPTLPTAERKKIYIQPAGKFSETQRKVLSLTADYMKAFYSLPVELKPELKLENVPLEMERKNPIEGHRQIRTHHFLVDLLPTLLPDDAAAFICFTNVDLYPDENWNFVFGQASLEKRVGVWSLYRFGNPDKSAEDFNKFLARTLKIAMHETGHMFTMRHCAKYECLMSGTNHLDETDRRPLDVCPECMAKIAWAMNYEPSERYQNLATFWEKQNWMEEKELFLKKAGAITEASKQ